MGHNSCSIPECSVQPCFARAPHGRLRHRPPELFRLPPPAPAPTLPHRLIQDDGSRGRNIETSHVAEHWNTDHLVAPFPHEPAQPVTFSSHDERCWKGE